MKKIALALSALAGIVMLSGCAYDTGYGRYAYDSGVDRYGYGWDSGYRVPVHHVYLMNGVQYDCFYSFNSRFCG